MCDCRSVQEIAAAFKGGQEINEGELVLLYLHEKEAGQRNELLTFDEFYRLRLEYRELMGTLLTKR